MHGFERATIQVLRVGTLLLTTFYICSCAASTPNQELQFAAMQGRTETVKLLVSKGIDVNSKNWYEVRGSGHEKYLI
jgi:ankyrin repeat protein